MKWLIGIAATCCSGPALAAPVPGSLGDTLNVGVNNAGQVQRSAALSGPSGSGVVLSGYSLGIDSGEALVLKNQSLDPATVVGNAVENFTGSEIAGGAAVRVVNTGLAGGAISGALLDELTTLVANGLDEHSGGYIPSNVSTPIIRGVLNGDDVEGLVEDTVLTLVLDEAERLVVGQLGTRIQNASGGRITAERVREAFRRATRQARPNP